MGKRQTGRSEPGPFGGSVTELAGVPIEPGQWVRHPAHPEWGLGQVQSAIGERVTVNFENRGKVLVNIRLVPLEPADPFES